MTPRRPRRKPASPPHRPACAQHSAGIVKATSPLPCVPLFLWGPLCCSSSQKWQEMLMPPFFLGFIHSFPIHLPVHPPWQVRDKERRPPWARGRALPEVPGE